MTKEKGREQKHMEMLVHTKEDGKKVKSMGMENKHIIDVYTREDGKKVKSMGMENKHIKVVVHTREDG
ncbi:hypothetical protein FACS1894152_0470 [Bacilli bacterium]|nr:hypothetical protein FACS1894152_0330 [Bacilli bacterium]GHU26253.1 hypothetical protein FACS1894152_0470 [Bacilli bacterium]